LENQKKKKKGISRQAGTHRGERERVERLTGGREPTGESFLEIWVSKIPDKKGKTKRPPSMALRSRVI